MAVIQDPDNSTSLTKVDPYLKGVRTTIVPRGQGYSMSGITGTMAAALAINSTVFAMRMDPASSPMAAYLTRIRVRFTTIVAFTAAVTAGRRLAIYRGSGAAASGGTAITAPVKHITTDPNSEISSAQGGDARIATTAGLTTTGITFESEPIRTMSLTHVGTAGASVEEIFEFDNTGPLILLPGELLAIRNPIAMDAGGTWTLDVDTTWFEV